MTLITFLALLVLCVPPAHAFDVPERLEYEISWLGITTGHSSLEIRRNGAGRLVMVSMANSVDWVTKIYPVNDRVESIAMDFPDWTPLKYDLNTSEGDRKRSVRVFFEPQENTADYHDFINDEQGTEYLPAQVYDPLMALYEVRRRQLVVGQSVYIPLFDARKFYMLEVQVLDEERVKVPAGKFDTLQVVPLLQSEGIFSREGPIYTWMTNDERHIPVMIKTRVKIGSIYAKLVRVVRGNEVK